MTRIHETSGSGAERIAETGDASAVDSRTQEPHDYQAAADVRPAIRVSGELSAAGLRAKIEGAADGGEAQVEVKGDPTSATGGALLVVGSTGPEVLELQDKLIRSKELSLERMSHGEGVYADIIPDFEETLRKLKASRDGGTYDTATAAVVADMQSYLGLEGSGAADAVFIAALDRHIAEKDAELEPIRLREEARKANGGPGFFADEEAVFVATPDGPKVDHWASAKANLKEAASFGLAGGLLGGFMGVGAAVMSIFSLSDFSDAKAGAIMLGTTVGMAALFGVTDLAQAGAHAVMAGLGAGFQDDGS